MKRLLLLSTVVLVICVCIQISLSSLNMREEQAAVASNHVDPGYHLLEIIHDLKPGQYTSFKIDKVVRTEDFVDGIQWTFFVKIRNKDNKATEAASFKINATDDQVKIINDDSLTESYIKVTEKKLGPGTLSFRPYDLEIQMPPGVNIVEYR